MKTSVDVSMCRNEEFTELTNFIVFTGMEMKNENLIKDPKSCLCNIPGIIFTNSSQSTETQGFAWEWEWNKANSMKKNTTQYANS